MNLCGIIHIIPKYKGEKMKNKLVAVLVAITMILATCIGVVAVNAAEKLQIVIETVEAEPGDEVEVKINLVNNEAISSLKADVSWPDTLTLLYAEYDIYNPKDKSAMINEPDEMDDDFNPIWEGITGHFVFNWLTAKSKVSGDTAFVTLKFKVADDASGLQEIKATINPADVFVNDGDETPNVPFELTDGGVKLAQSAVYYTVSFNSDGGTEVASQSVLAGEIVEQPADPEKENYNFIEWQLEGKAYDFAQPVNGDIVLTAVYEKKEAQIEDQSSEVGDEGVTGEATANYNIVKVGFKVDGNEDQIIWKDVPADDVGKSVSYDIDFEELGIDPGSHTIEIVVEVDDGKNTILPITADPIEVVINEPLPQEFEIVIDTVEAKPGDEVKVKINLVGNPGVSSIWADVSWPEDLELINAVYDIYNPKDKSAMINEPDEVDDDYNPIWTGVSGHFVFNWITAKSKVTGDTTFVTLTFKVSETATNGLKVVDADISDDDVFVNVDGGNEFEELDYTFTAGGVNVTDGVEVNEYTVTFNSDGGSEVEAQTVEDGSVATKPADPTKEGFEFVEWQLNGAAYDFSTPVTSDIELVAVYKPVSTGVSLINVHYDGLEYDGTLKLKEGSVDKQIVLPENRSELDFTKGDVKVITVRGWVRISENSADIKGFGYSIDGGDVVEGEFVQDRVAELATAGFPGGQGFKVNVPVDELGEGEHSIDVYLITKDGEQIKIVKDRSTDEQQIINQVGVTFTVNKPTDGPDNPDNPPTADVAIMAVAAVAAVALAGVMIGKKALKKY